LQAGLAGKADRRLLDHPVTQIKRAADGHDAHGDKPTELSARGAKQHQRTAKR